MSDCKVVLEVKRNQEEWEKNEGQRREGEKKYLVEITKVKVEGERVALKTKRREA